MKERNTRLNYKSFIVCACLLLTLVGCHNEMNETALMQLSLCLPDQDRLPVQRMKRIGDPGTAEQFELPKYAYILVLKDNGGGDWSVWRREQRVLASGDWIRTRYNGSRQTPEDSIYKYNRPIQFMLQNDNPVGRVYAICSNKQLTFNTAFNSVSDLSDVLNWAFDSSPDSIQENLQNIYSTPYNYTVSGDYYCSFDCSSGHSATMDLILYHIASKVDIKWNVADTMRIKADPSEAVRLTYLEAMNLFNGNAYCFKPMENEQAAILNAGQTVSLVTPTDEGLWWEGRGYFYTIPYTVTGTPNYFPLQFRMRTNGSADTYQPTLNMRVNTSEPFVPWLRANFNLSKPLTEKTETKTVDN